MSARLEKDIFVKTHLHTSPIVVNIPKNCTKQLRSQQRFTKMAEFIEGFQLAAFRSPRDLSDELIVDGLPMPRPPEGLGCSLAHFLVPILPHQVKQLVDNVLKL